MNNTLKSTSVSLSLMMFFQYMMFSVWWVPLAAYLTNMNFGRLEKSLALSSMAIGCLASPVIGMIADRYFDGKKVLTLINIISSLLLLFAGFTTNSGWLFLCLLLAMLLYMPSWGLTSSIAMSHLKSEEFSKIRLFGSVGWVVSGIFSLISIKVFNSPFDGTNLPFFIAAAIGFLAGILNLFLPATPPAGKGKRFSVSDAFGLRTVTLMRERNFAMFIILSFLFMIPFSMYFSYCSEFLLNRNFKYISITMNMGQLLEMLFLFTIPLSIKKAGLRNTMIFGIIAMVIRYIVFYAGTVTDVTGFLMTGIMLQGIIFGYFLVGGQIYIDRKAPAELKAQAQGFIFFVTIGLGLLAGNFISGQLIEHFSSAINGIRAYDWDSIWAVTSVSTLVLLLAFIVLFKKEKESSDRFVNEVIREAVPDVK